MPSKPVSPTFDPFIAEIARSTASLVLSAIKPEFLRPSPPPVAAAPDELLNKQANNPPADDDNVSTVDEFCARNQISRGTVYKFWRVGRGPNIWKWGRRKSRARPSASGGLQVDGA